MPVLLTDANCVFTCFGYGQQPCSVRSGSALQFVVIFFHIDPIHISSEVGLGSAELHYSGQGKSCSLAIKAMTREGFPAEKIYYYRGGMLDWDALGLTVVKDEF